MTRLSPVDVGIITFAVMYLWLWIFIYSLKDND